MNEPSMREANKVLRVLKGKPLKYTVRVTILASEEVVEFQSGGLPDVKWDDSCRGLWLFVKTEKSDYNSYPAMEWKPGMIIHCEENPT